MRKPVLFLTALLAICLPGCGQGNSPQENAKPSAMTNSAAPAPSDQQVLSKVKSALATLQGVDSGKIDVSVASGIVTLEGQVSGADQRQHIVQVVSSIDGVQTVIDHLVLAAG